ncbi:MAG: hypothetical protein V1811_01615, partial [Candidatus Micrarchaeota archaeon]
GLTVPTAAIAISKPGSGEDVLKQILIKIGAAAPAPEKKEVKEKKEARPKAAKKPAKEKAVKAAEKTEKAVETKE